MTTDRNPAAQDAESLRTANELYRLGVLLRAKAQHALRIVELILPAAAAMREGPWAEASASGREITERLAAFGRGDSFVEQVLAYHARGIGAPNYQHYVHYALTSVDRGREVAARIGQYRTFEGARCLDVGTGWGGYLVAFAEQGAGECVGFEVEEALIRAARANIAEHGVNARVERVDATDPRAIAPFGPFDIITCDAVIEHVADPRVLIRHLAGLCAPGGVVLINVPNKRAFACVLKDPHHGLFGSVLLDREASLRRFREVFPAASPFTLGELWALEQTMAAVREHGLEPNLPLHEIPCESRTLEDIERGYEQVRQARDAFLCEGGASAEMRETIMGAVDSYLRELHTDLARFREAGGTADAAGALDLVVRYHLHAHWLLCFRPGGAVEPGIRQGVADHQPWQDATVVWRCSDAEEAARWRGACLRGTAAVDSGRQGLIFRVRPADSDSNSLYVYRPLGLRFVAEPHLGLQFRLRGWGHNPRMRVGVMIGEAYYGAAVQASPVWADGTCSAQLGPSQLRHGEKRPPRPLPPEALLRVVVTGVPEPGGNELVIESIWL